MSSIDQKTLICAVALSMMPWSGQALAATIVVRSNGPSAASYPPGKKLADNGTIVLKPGDTVTVLDAHGTRVLHGAGTVPVAGTGTATVNGIAALIADSGMRQTRTGATRGQNTRPHPTNVWMVDLTHGGPFCVVDAKALSLWRAATETAASVVLTRMTDGKQAAVAFRAGQSVATWPADTITAGTGSVIGISGLADAKPVTIDLKLLPAIPVTLDETADALLAQGCTSQLDLLIDATVADNN